MENISSFSPNGFCVACSGQTSLCCHRCGDFYCSRKCQLKDWQRHRYICFSIPALVHSTACSALGSAVVLPPQQLKNANTDQINAAITEPRLKEIIPEIKASEIGGEVKQEQCKVLDPPPLVPLETEDECDKKSNSTESESANMDNNNSKTQKINLKDFHPPGVAKPPNNSVVYLTGFRSANRCFIREVSETVDQAHARVCEQVNLLSQAQPSLKRLNGFDYALVKHNGQFNRVKVLAARNNFNARLLFMDLGIIKVRNGAEARIISVDALRLPCFSVEVQLQNVPNLPMHAKLFNFLAQFDEKRFSLTYGSDKNVELLHIGTEKPINAEICAFGSNFQIFSKEVPSSTPSKRAETPRESNELDVEIPLTKSAEKCPSIVSSKPLSDVGQLMQMLVPNHSVTKGEVQENKETNMEIENNSQLDTKAKENISPTTNKIEIYALENVRKEAPTENDTTNLEHSPNKAQAMTPPDPNKLLKATKLPTNVLPTPALPNAAEPLLTPPFELRRLSTVDKEGLDLFVVENSNVSRGIIGAFDCRYAIEFSKLHSCLSNFNDPAPYNPTVKEYVIAKFNKSWYRAKVISKKETANGCLYNIMYLEFTNTSTVSAEHIRRYPADLTDSCYTNICVIEGFPHRPTKAQTDYVNEKLQMHCSLHVDSLNYQHNMAFIKCNELINQLNKLS